MTNKFLQVVHKRSLAQRPTTLRVALQIPQLRFRILHAPWSARCTACSPPRRSDTPPHLRFLLFQKPGHALQQPRGPTTGPNSAMRPRGPTPDLGQLAWHRLQMSSEFRCVFAHDGSHGWPRTQMPGSTDALTPNLRRRGPGTFRISTRLRLSTVIPAAMAMEAIRRSMVPMRIFWLRSSSKTSAAASSNGKTWAREKPHIHLHDLYRTEA